MYVRMTNEMTNETINKTINNKKKSKKKHISVKKMVILCKKRETVL